MTVLLESKQFQNRIKLADSMEASFLIRYFGSNQKTLLFAKELIEVGHKAALVELNRHVEVLGSDFDSEPLILKLRTQFKVVESDSVAYMKRQVINNNSLENAKMLAHVSGYEVTLKKGGFFSLDNYEVRNIASNKQISFNFSDDFIHWVVQNLCQK